MAKTGLAQLPKAERKIASTELAKRTRKLRESQAMSLVVNTTVGMGTTVVAAGIDHKFRKGAEAEARFGGPEAKFRPPVNGVVGGVALVAGIAGALYKKKWSGPVLAGGIGFASPALYSFTRNQLAK